MTPVDTPVVDAPTSPTACAHKRSWVNQWAKPTLKSITSLCLAVLLAYLKYGRPSHSPALIRWSKASLVGLLVVNVAVMQWVEHTMVLPKIQQYQQQGVQRGVGKEGQAFDAMHHKAEGLFKAHAVAEAILLVVTIL